MARVSPALVVTFRDRNGKLLSNGSLHTFQAGTNKPLPTYTSAAGTTEAPNPIPLGDSATVTLWLGQPAYKFVVKDSLGRIVRVIDRVTSVAINSISTADLDDEAVTTDKIKDGSILARHLANDVVTEEKIDEATVEESHLENIVPLFQPFVGADLQPRYRWKDPVMVSQVSTFTDQFGASRWQESAAGWRGPSRPAWSPDSRILAVGSSDPIFPLSFFERCGTGFYNRIPSGESKRAAERSCAFSPSGEFFVIRHGSSPFFTIFKRTGAADFAKIADPADLPSTAEGLGVAWSPNGRFLAAVGSGDSNARVWERSGSTFTLLEDVISERVATADIAWSPDGRILVFVGAEVLDNSQARFTAYEVIDNTFTLISPPDEIPELSITAVKFSRDGKLMVIGLDRVDGDDEDPTDWDPGIVLYSVSGTSFEKYADPDISPAGHVFDVSFHPDGKFLAVAHFEFPYLSIYRIEKGRLKRDPDPAALPPGPCHGCAFSPDGRFLAVTTHALPYICMYETSFRFNPNGVAVYEGVS